LKGVALERIELAAQPAQIQVREDPCPRPVVGPSYFDGATAFLRWSIPVPTVGKVHRLVTKQLDPSQDSINSRMEQLMLEDQRKRKGLRYRKRASRKCVDPVRANFGIAL
jgi:hypothetical protein